MPRLDDVLAARGAPAAVGWLELAERRVREATCRSPASHASRSSFVIAWPVRSPTWSRRFARRAAAAREPVAAVLARELDAELLEPVDRGGRLARSAPRRAGGRRSRARSGRCPRRAARASRRRRTRPGCRPAPSRSCSPAASPSSRARRGRRALGGNGGGEARGPAADHEHVEASPRRALHAIVPRSHGLHAFIVRSRLTRSSRAAPRSRRQSPGGGSPGCPPRAPPAAATAGDRSSGTPKSRSRSKPPRRASARRPRDRRRRRSPRRTGRRRPARAAG